jgi:hypothetical protein
MMFNFYKYLTTIGLGFEPCMSTAEFHFKPTDEPFPKEIHNFHIQ